MIVNHTHKFIFVHVPKAAGTSITSALASFTGYRDQEIGGTSLGEAIQPHYWRRFGLRKHSTAADIKKIVGDDEWNEYFKFAFVRDPLKRLISAFHFLKGWEGLSEENRDRLSQYSTLESFLLSNIWRDWAGPDNMFLPQANWVTQQKDGEVLLDFVGKIEELERDVQYVASRVGLALQVEHIKQMNKSSYKLTEAVGANVLGDIREFYRVDYDLFRY